MSESCINVMVSMVTGVSPSPGLTTNHQMLSLKTFYLALLDWTVYVYHAALMRTHGNLIKVSSSIANISGFEFFGGQAHRV